MSRWNWPDLPDCIKSGSVIGFLNQTDFLPMLQLLKQEQIEPTLESADTLFPANYL